MHRTADLLTDFNMFSPAETPTLTDLADRTDRLVSLPAVAIEMLRLTDQPTIDAFALCECLESDPAMAAKLLRVVNSSLYSMPRQIASLREALTIIGVQPLKMLVLGFSLPEDLLAGVSGEALQRYWTETLTTATAGRLIAEAGWGRLGDEVLVAGLLQGIGQLVLLRHLGEDYAQLLAATGNPLPMQPRRSPLPIERESFGFDHRALSAELVRRWYLPERLAEAIERQDGRFALVDLEGDEACLAQSLSIANQLTNVVVYRDLQSLPSVLDDCQRFAGITKPQLNSIVASLRERIDQLGRAMAVDWNNSIDYHQILVEAHDRLALVAEQQALRAMGETRSQEAIHQDEQLAQEVLLETKRLTAAMRVFLSGGTGPRTDTPTLENSSTPESQQRPQSVAAPNVIELIDQAIARCRAERRSLTLSLVEVAAKDRVSDADVMALRGWLIRADCHAELANALWVPITRDRCAVLISASERVDVKRMWTEIANQVDQSTSLRLNAGVAGVAQLSRGFDAARLLEPAERCLEAARETKGISIKSIEVF